MNTLLPQATRDLIQEYLGALPQYMQDTLERMDWTGELARIGAKHRLGQEQITNLTVETAMTLFGISEPQLFYNNIMNHTGVSGEIAESITRDVAERIFDRMQEMIHDGYGDQIMALQDELTQVEAEQDGGNEILKKIGIDIGGTDDELDTNEVVPMNQVGDRAVAGSSLAEKKMSRAFSLDSVGSGTIRYPDADPYHEDLTIDVTPEPIRQKPPTPPTAPKGASQEKAAPSMMVPPMPPAPPAPGK